MRSLQLCGVWSYTFSWTKPSSLQQEGYKPEYWWSPSKQCDRPTRPDRHQCYLLCPEMLCLSVSLKTIGLHLAADITSLSVLAKPQETNWQSHNACSTKKQPYIISFKQIMAKQYLATLCLALPHLRNIQHSKFIIFLDVYFGELKSTHKWSLCKICSIKVCWIMHKEGQFCCCHWRKEREKWKVIILTSKVLNANFSTLKYFKEEKIM